MQPDKKQNVQLVVLGVLVVAFVGFLSFNFLAPKKSVPKTQPAAKAIATDQHRADEASEGSADDAAEITPDSAVAGVFPDLLRIPARRDPFLPQKLPSTEPENRENRAPRLRPQLQTRPLVANPFANVPRISVPPVNPFGAANRNSGTLPAATEQRDDQPVFVLTGVVRGVENVAIIRTGEKGDEGRYVVKQGQLIEGRYRVLYVTPEAVVLADKNRRIYVRLGGAKNAS